MSSGYAAKALDGHKDGESKVQDNLQMTVMEGLRTHTAHAAQEDQDSRADELAQEGGDFVQRRSLHFEYLTATEKVEEAVEKCLTKKLATLSFCPISLSLFLGKPA